MQRSAVQCGAMLKPLSGDIFERPTTDHGPV